MCFHTNGLLYKSERLEATPDVRSVPLGEKRRKGRPKKLPNSLVKSPIRVPISSNDPNDDKVSKPDPVKCKKKTGTCSHEIVFGEHYAKVAWYRYAEHVRKKKSTIEVDPEYVPSINSIPFF